MRGSEKQNEGRERERVKRKCGEGEMGRENKRNED